MQKPAPAVIPTRQAGTTALILVTYERPPAPGLLNLLKGKVDWLIIVDNSTTPAVRDQIDAAVGELPVNHLVIHNPTNLGVARALNTGIESARVRDCESVYLLDGDALVEPDFFPAERACLESVEAIDGLNPGVVVPIVTDDAPAMDPPSARGEWTAVRSIITSGVFARISTVLAVGGFNESLFVEGVDFDFASRMRASGRTLVRINRVLVRQLFGAPVGTTRGSSRWLESLYGAFQYTGILVGRSNSFHTRLSSYSLQRRAEYVRSHRSLLAQRRSGALPQAMAWVGVLSQLVVDALASRDPRFLRLAFGSP